MEVKTPLDVKDNYTIRLEFHLELEHLLDSRYLVIQLDSLWTLLVLGASVINHRSLSHGQPGQSIMLAKDIVSYTSV